MERRNTIQRSMVLQAVKDLHNHPTADEIYGEVIKNHPSIGKGTVYRNLSILVEEGFLRKIEISNGPDHFDHTLDEHYHVQCIKCKKVYDVSMNSIDILNHLNNSNGFQFISYDILIKGICPDCQK